MTYKDLRDGINNETVKEGALIYAYIDPPNRLPFGSLQTRYCIMQLKKDDVIDPFVIVFEHETNDYCISCARQAFTLSLFSNYNINILSDEENIPEKLLKSMDLQRIKILNLVKSIMEQSVDAPSRYYISDAENFYSLTDTKESMYSECIRIYKTEPVINNGYFGYIFIDSEFPKKCITEDEFKKIRNMLHDSCYYIRDLIIRFGNEYIKQDFDDNGRTG